MWSTKRSQRRQMQKMQKQESAMEETGTHPLKHAKLSKSFNDGSQIAANKENSQALDFW
jgi:hypothetical protein